MSRKNTWRPTAKQYGKLQRNRDQRTTNNGYVIGLLCAAAVLHDDMDFDFDGDQLQKLIIDCDTLMYSMTNEMDDWREIRRELERITGIRLNLNEDGKPQDGRFAIVDISEPEEEEYDD